MIKLNTLARGTKDIASLFPPVSNLLTISYVLTIMNTIHTPINSKNVKTIMHLSLEKVRFACQFIVFSFFFYASASLAGNTCSFCSGDDDEDNYGSNIFHAVPEQTEPSSLTGVPAPVYTDRASYYGHYDTWRPRLSSGSYTAQYRNLLFSITLDELDEMLLYTYDRRLYRRNPSTRQYYPFDTHGEQVRYVMHQSGRIYAGDLPPRPSPLDNRIFAHTSFFNWGPVAGAGMIEAADGFLTYLNRRTGHYLTNANEFRQVIDELWKRNIHLDSSIVPREQYYGIDLDFNTLLLPPDDSRALDWYPKDRDPPPPGGLGGLDFGGSGFGGNGFRGNGFGRGGGIGIF